MNRTVFTKIVKQSLKFTWNKPQSRSTMSGIHPHLELDIPRLPIPTLEQTCNKYLKVLQTLVPPEQLEGTKKVVNEFLTKDGPHLQTLLTEHDKTQPHASYIETFWDDMYLTLRCQNPIHVNPYFVLQRARDEKKSQVERAAQITWASVRLYQKIQANRLNFDMEGVTPLCMSQYGRLFATYRLPKQDRDELTTVVSRHIVVMCENQFFRLDVINDNGTTMSEEEIITNLTSIIENSNESSAVEKFNPIGVLTTDERDIWYNNRSHLEKSEKNRKSLSVIDNALFVLVLESTQPTTITESSKLIFHGSGQNRWFDKLQVIVCKNGRAGLNMEHSGYDGHTLLQYASYIYSDHVTKVVKQTTRPLPSYSTNLKKMTYSKMGWEMDDVIKNEIKESIKRFDAFTGMTQTHVLKFDKYGKNWVTRNKMSPDAFVQMAYQLTYYRMFGHIGETYESVNTKQFLHGRTETGRPATVESTIFTKLMMDPTADAQTRINALRKACVAHVEELRQCKNGFGVDRHFFALQGVAKREIKKNPEMKMPSLYTDPSYAVLKTDMMSTSNCGDDEALDVFGFGPTSEKGFGIGYVVKDNSMIFNITHFQGRAEDYAKMLDKTFLDLRDMVESV